MSNYTIGYHDYIDESFDIAVDTTCLDQTLPKAERKWIIRFDDCNIFLSQARAKVLRDKLNIALAIGEEIDDGGVSDIERENDAQTVCEDAEVEF